MAVDTHSPRIVDVVTLLGERFHQADILQEPIAVRIVRTVAIGPTIVIPSVYHENPNRLSIAGEDLLRIDMSSLQIDKRSDSSQHFVELIRTLPRNGEGRDRSRTPSGDSVMIGIARDLVLLIESGEQLLHDDLRVLVAQGVVFVLADRSRVGRIYSRVDELSLIHI